MTSDCIPFRDTGFFSSLILNYLDGKKSVEPFYDRHPALTNFKGQIEEKSKVFNVSSRQVLVDVLKDQYQNISISKTTQKNIDNLASPKTFTVTTGHQLNLFTGPLYFLYKIVSAIKLCGQLEKEYPDYDFVPVYWMATEDHDFDEINFFKLNNQKIEWPKTCSGPVGRLGTEGLGVVFNHFKSLLGNDRFSQKLLDLFGQAYLSHKNLSEATRFLANELFGAYGLVILDADDQRLKKALVPAMKQEILNQLSYTCVSETNTQLQSALNDGFKPQVNPRAINMFYMEDALRERIAFRHGHFEVLNTPIKWNQSEILTKIGNHPENFSPNVLMRPLYQELILPNLCYIGGGGELAYWLQLKSYFEASSVPFPILLLRNSLLVKTKKQAKKLNRLGVSEKEIFLDKASFINQNIKRVSNISIDFSEQKNHLKKQFKALYRLAEQTDRSFMGAVSAQERKQTKGLEYLEKRLLKAQKRKLKELTGRLSDIKDELFPNGSLQERTVNFSDFYLQFGDDFIPMLVDQLNPMDLRFQILTL